MLVKVNTVLLVVLLGAMAWLAVQQQKLEEIIVQAEAKNTSPIITTIPATPAEGASPFDNPNTDPMANMPESTVQLTRVKFKSTKLDLGKVMQGQKIRGAFEVTNIGDKPLTILGAEGSCGCTVPSYSKEPIAPGKSTKIDIEFDSSGKMGEQSKPVKVRMNTDVINYELIVNATVIPTDN